jgi:HSP20 family protein
MVDMPTLTRQPQTTSPLVDQIEALKTDEAWQPAHELIRTDRAVTLFVDLPGILAQNLHAATRDGRLFVWGHRNPTHYSKALSHVSTRRFGAFALDVSLPDWVDPRRASQRFEDGILTVVFPKRRESQPSAHGPL